MTRLRVAPRDVTSLPETPPSPRDVTPVARFGSIMTEDTAASTVPDLSARALREWMQLVERVLRGIAHSLNNRASAIVAVLDLAGNAADALAVTTSILGSERARVEELVDVARTLGSPIQGSHAFTAIEAAIEAQRVVALHAGEHDKAMVVAAEEASPTRVPRWMFVRAVIAMAVSGGNAVSSARTPLRIVLAGDGDWLTATAADLDRRDLAALSPYAAELAAAMGGELLPDAFGFRVPTLAALRRREGR